MEGPYYQMPAIAVSIGKLTEVRGYETAGLVAEIIDRVIVGGKFPGILNVNVPGKKGKISIDNVVVVPQAVQIYRNVILQKKDRDGATCFRVVGDSDMSTAPQFSDIAGIRRGHVTVTPLRWQQTATAAMETVAHLIFHNH